MLTALAHTINHPATKRAGPSYAMQVRRLWFLSLARTPEGRSARARRGLRVKKMNQLMVIDRLKVFGEAATARNKRAYLYP